MARLNNMIKMAVVTLVIGYMADTSIFGVIQD